MQKAVVFLTAVWQPDTSLRSKRHEGYELMSHEISGHFTNDNDKIPTNLNT